MMWVGVSESSPFGTRGFVGGAGNGGFKDLSPSSISVSVLTQTLGQPLQLKWVARLILSGTPHWISSRAPHPPQLQGMLALHATSPLPGPREKEGVIVLGWGH